MNYQCTKLVDKRKIRFRQASNMNVTLAIQVYVPTDTLQRLTDKRIESNMVAINYQDVSTKHHKREYVASHGHPSHSSRVNMDENLVRQCLRYYVSTQIFGVDV
jgi:hypothetical protein